MKCGKCGKEMEVVGLNRTYPPKKDDMGREICPHCGYLNGPRGFALYTPTQDEAKEHMDTLAKLYEGLIDKMMPN